MSWLLGVACIRFDDGRSRDRFLRAVNEDPTSVQPIRSHLIRISDMMKVQILRKIPFLRGVELQQLQMLSPLLKYASLARFGPAVYT